MLFCFVFSVMLNITDIILIVAAYINVEFFVFLSFSCGNICISEDQLDAGYCSQCSRSKYNS